MTSQACLWEPWLLSPCFQCRSHKYWCLFMWLWLDLCSHEYQAPLCSLLRGTVPFTLPAALVLPLLIDALVTPPRWLHLFPPQAHPWSQHPAPWKVAVLAELFVQRPLGYGEVTGKQAVPMWLNPEETEAACVVPGGGVGAVRGYCRSDQEPRNTGHGGQGRLLRVLWAWGDQPPCQGPRRSSQVTGLAQVKGLSRWPCLPLASSHHPAGRPPRGGPDMPGSCRAVSGSALWSCSLCVFNIFVPISTSALLNPLKLNPLELCKIT